MMLVRTPDGTASCKSKMCWCQEMEEFAAVDITHVSHLASASLRRLIASGWELTAGAASGTVRRPTVGAREGDCALCTADTATGPCFALCCTLLD